MSYLLVFCVAVLFYVRGRRRGEQGALSYSFPSRPPATLPLRESGVLEQVLHLFVAIHLGSHARLGGQARHGRGRQQEVGVLAPPQLNKDIGALNTTFGEVSRIGSYYPIRALIFGILAAAK